MQIISVVPALLALAGLCGALAVFAGVPAGLCPLAAFSLVIFVLSAAGIAGVLAPAAWCLMAAGIVCGALALAQHCGVPLPGPKLPRHSAVRIGIDPGMVLFWGGALVLLVRLCLLQPSFVNFDEYSFWGPAAKLTTLYGRLYTVCPIGTPWQITQMPAIPLASYFVQLMGDYAAWKTIWAVDLLLLAAFAAVVQAVAGDRRLALPMGLICVLVPFALVLHTHLSYYTSPYAEAMGDVCAGVMFGGAAAFWLGLRRSRPQLWWLALPVLCLCANIKDNTFVLGLAAAGIAAADGLLLGVGDDVRFDLRSLTRRCGMALALLAAPAAQYAAWTSYTGALVRQNAAAGGMGETSQPLSAVLVQGIRLFLGLPAADYFEQRREIAYAYAHTLWDWFFTHPVSYLGSGAAVAAVVLVLFAAAVLIAPTVRQKLRAALAAVCSAACFGGYWLMLLLSYSFILKDSVPENPVSYARYFQSYYIGWFLLALAVFGAAARAAKRPLPVWLGRAGALVLAAVVAVHCAVNIEPQYTVLGVRKQEFAAAAQRQIVADWAVQNTPKDAELFLVYQGDNGHRWFEFSTLCLPRIVVYGAGGGTYGVPVLEQGAYYQAYTQTEFVQMVQQSGAEYLLVAKSDDIFVQSYAALFDDGLNAVQRGTVLYRVQSDGFALHAVMEQEVAR
ncbi:MAG: hypothetical protein IJ347_02775 [Faecalibacterium sp.]|nr:hypothetical protein [Faecalibacterium sp.]